MFEQPQADAPVRADPREPRRLRRPAHRFVMRAVSHTFAQGSADAAGR
jgi:hypothetical protein